ncbi:TetR/AcrR family transcriptional regulator [Brevibacterium picturae]|uniref:TetR/AcrR family transcriptional regulator n=1 Tax=Brevibacterium picturae TaxID=260553 RepID=A0ABN2B065_9MICO
MELAEAVWRVIERDGMNGATVRSVASEAGMSPGALRHYFSDQAGLLRFAAQTMTRRVVARLQQHLATGTSGIELSWRLLEEMLPVDSNRRIEVIVWLEGISRARHDPDLDEAKASGWFGERYICRAAWANARGLPVPQQLTEELTPEDEAAIGKLHTFMDGLTLQAIAFPEQVTPSQAAQQMRDFLSTLLSEVNSHRRPD